MEEYIEYWGLKQDPFLLAPDSRMMCVTGQYYECLERLKYAISTDKGGVLIASEDAGLGKTTSLLKLIDDMKEAHGDGFRYAYIDHPTLSPSQMIAQITAEISGAPAGDDKLENLGVLKSALVRAKEQKGKTIIIVDEGQLLCGTPDVLQELRMLINLTHNGEYLHTFILSGQRILWHTIKNMPEFWQRLPVRFYFVPLKLDETKELVRHRLSKAGIEKEREVFSMDALEILHRYSKGSPRTVMALADLSLLVGYTNRTERIGFQEVLKAINAMSGQGESLPYVREEYESSARIIPAGGSAVDRNAEVPSWRETYPAAALRATPVAETTGSFEVPRPVFAAAAVFVLILAALFAGYRYMSHPSRSTAAIVPAKTEELKSAAPEVREQAPASAAEEAKAPTPTPETPTPPARAPTSAPANAPASAPVAVPASVPASAPASVPANARPDVASPAPPKEQVVYRKEAAQEKKELRFTGERTGVVVVEGANVRSSPRLNASKVDLVLMDRTVKIVDHQKDGFGRTWYMVSLPNGKRGWVHENVIQLR